MPKLEEGNFWIRATLPISISLEQSARYVGRMRSIVRGCPTDEGATCTKAQQRRPEVQTVISQLGRPDDGTDVSGFYNIELLAPLLPAKEWRQGLTKETMTQEIQKDLANAFPGVVFNFSQVISDNVEEAMSGVKGENTVKVVGPDLHVDEAKAEEIEGVLAKVPGVEDLGIFRSLGQPAIRITPLSHADRTLRPQHRRRGCGRASRHWRAGHHPGVRRRKALRSDPALGGAVPARRALHSQHPGVHARWLASAARPAGRGRRRRRPVGDLPRGSEALRAGEVLGARARSRLDHFRGPGAHQGCGQAALRHPPGMGRRNESAARDHRAPAYHRAHHAAHHRLPGLQLGQELARHPHRAARGSGGVAAAA